MKKICTLLLFMAVLLFAACSDPSSSDSSGSPSSPATDSKKITSFVFTNSSSISVIDQDSRTVLLVVPYGTDLTCLIPSIVHSGASISPEAGAAMDFSGAVIFTVTAKDGSTADYTVTVTAALSSSKAITSFAFTSPAAVGVIDEELHTVTVDIPSGTDVSALAPAVTHSGISVSPASGVAQDFTGTIIYTVTAENGTVQPYEVSVNILPSYTVTFDSQGGSDVDSQTVSEGELAEEPECPSSGGKGFEGWFRETTFENKWEFSADTVEGDVTLYARWHDGTEGLKYTLINDSAEYEVGGGTTDGTGTVTIPPYWKGKSVTTVSENAFKLFDELEYITIPNSITSLGKDAFYSCTSLVEISLPESVTAIGEYAFYLCKSLTEVILPENVESLGAFALKNCYNLTNVEILSNLSAIENGTFYYCYNLTDVSLPDTVASIGSTAFSKCYALEEVELPSGLTSLGSSAFLDCIALISIAVPAGVTILDDKTFYGCDLLVSVSLPTNLQTIGDEAFFECFDLKNITIPAKVTEIGENAFSRCISLEEIAIPSGVTILPKSVFAYCSSLASVTIDDDDQTGDDDLTAIEDSAFYSCSSLESLNVPDSVTTLGKAVFHNCSSLASINVPAGISEIEMWTFASMALTNVTIPANVESIDYCAFAGNTNLADVYMLSETAPTMGSYVFSSVEDCTLHIKADAAGYDVSPWTDEDTFSSLLEDL